MQYRRRPLEVKKNRRNSYLFMKEPIRPAKFPFKIIVLQKNVINTPQHAAESMNFTINRYEYHICNDSLCSTIFTSMQAYLRRC